MKKLIKWCAAAGAVSLLSGCIIMAAAAGLGGSIPGSRFFHPLRGIFGWRNGRRTSLIIWEMRWRIFLTGTMTGAAGGSITGSTAGINARAADRRPKASCVYTD